MLRPGMWPALTLLLVGEVASALADPGLRALDRLAAAEAQEPARFVTRGTADVVDSTHPRRPGDAQRETLAVGS